MRRQRTRRRKRLLIILIPVAIAAVIILSVFRMNAGITGTEWLLYQESYIEQFEQLAEDTDDITALYLSGSISEDDFLNHVAILRAELEIMDAAYQQDVDSTSVKNGTHTYSSKRGSEAIPACFDAFYDLYNAMENCSDDPSKLSYVYLAYEQVMLDAVADYETALSFLYLGVEEGEE